MKKSAVFIIFSLVVSVFLTLSCQVGLGDAVDTEAPQFEITNPPINSIIRGDFNIQGTFSDDGEIDFVDVVLESTTYKDQKYSYKGTFDAESGTWKNLVSPVSGGIKDGPYQISVTMEDKAGHKTVQTRQITVDNTAPVIVLQRPSSVSSATSDIDGYGQKFTLTGQAADDNNVSLIELSVYSDADRKNLLTTIPLTNVPPTIELDAAEFKEGIDNTYSKIYQSKTKVGPKKLYCSLKAYDGAQSYPTDGSNQTPEDLKGNCTSYYYLYEQISSSVLSNYKVTELYKMFSGNYESTDATKTASDVVASVQKLLADKKITAGSFTLNPANNPTFIVSGRDELKKDGTDFVSTNTSNILTNGTAAVIEVSCGLDAIPLNADSLRVYVQECDDNGNVIAGAQKIYPSDSTKSKSGTSYKFVVKCSRTDGLEFGHKYIFGVDGKDEKNNDVISSGNGYGFRLASNGAAPVLTVNSPLSTINYLKKGANQEISGYIVVEDGIPDLTITNTVTINGASNTYDVYSKVFTSAEAENISSGKKYSFSYIVPAGNGGFNQSESSQNAFTITTSEEGLSTAVTKTVMYDVDGPSVSLDSMLPTAYKYLDDESGATDGNEYLNGDVTLKLSITDDYDTVDTSVNKPFFEIVDSSNNQLAFKVDSETTASTVHYITNPTRQNFVIHTTDIPNQTVRLRIYAWDRAGNCYVDSTNGNAYLEKTYMVDQDTDKPVILPNSNSNVSLTYATHEARDAGNKSSFPSGGQLLLKLIDDDGIKNVKVYRVSESRVPTGDDIESSTHTYSETPPDYTNFPTEMVYTHVLPSEADYYRIKVVVTDKNNKQQSVGPFFIRVTAAAPSLLTVTASPSVVSTVSSASLAPGSVNKFTNTIEISGTEAPFYIFRKKGSDFVNNDIPGTKPDVDANGDFSQSLSLGANVVYAGKTSSTTYGDEITPASGDVNTTWYYKIVDKNWNATNTKSVTDYIDSAAPSSVVITSPEGVTSGYATSISGTSYYFSGTATDADAPANQRKSGISKIRYAIVRNDSSNTQPAAPTNESDWTTVTASSEWSVNKQLGTGTTGSDKLYEGHYWLFVQAIDAAGNMSASPVVREFYVDQNAPTSTFVIQNSTSSSITYDDRSFVNTSIDVNGVANDTHDISSVTLTATKENESTPAFSEDLNLVSLMPPMSGYTWEKTITLANGQGQTGGSNTLLDGKYTFNILVKDKAGKTYSESKIISIDTTNPVGSYNTSLFNPAKSTTEGTGATAKDWYTSNTIKFNISVTDDNLDSVEITTDSDYVNSTNYQSLSKVIGQTNQYQGTLSLNDSPDANTGITVWTRMTDKAGNISYKDTTVYIDSEKPALSAISGKQDLMPQTGFTISGTATDNLKLKDIKILRQAPGETSFTVVETISDSGTSKSWSSTLLPKINGSEVVQGNYTFAVKVTDNAGNEYQSESFTTLLDITAPVLSFTNPGTSVADARTGTNAINETTFRFEGGITEDNAVSGIYYMIKPAGQSAPSVPSTGSLLEDSTWTSISGYTKATAGTTTWNAAQSFVNGTTDPGNGSYCEGTGYTMYVFAIDRAGNLSDANSSIAGNQPYSVSFDVDMAAPLVETKLDGTLFDSISTQTKTEDYVFKYKVSDSYGLDATNPAVITIKRNNVAIGNTASSAAVYYSIETADTDGFNEIIIHRPDGTGSSYSLDGLYEYSIKGKDKVGKETIVTRNVRLDTVPPEITIVSPSLSDSNGVVYQNNANVIINGSTEDDSGTDAVYYAFGNASAPSTPSAADALNQTVWTNSTYGWKKAFGTTSWKITGTVDSSSFDTGAGTGLAGVQGTAKNLYLVAVDKNGKISAIKTDTLKIDTENPTFVNCYIKKTGDASEAKPASLVTNEGFFISGEIWDANGIKSVKITSGTDEWTLTDAESPITVSGTLADAKSSATAVSFTKQFVVGSSNSSAANYLADGGRDFTVTITDDADKVTTKTLSVNIDTVNPTVSFNPTEFNPTVKETIDSKPWYNKGSVKFVVTVNELNVETVEATTDSVNYQAFSLVSGTTNKYQGSVALAEDSNTVTVKVTDTAGNEGSAETTVYVDTVPPAKIRAYNDEGTELSGTVLTNGQAAKTIYIEADDGFTSKVVTGGSAPSEWPTGYFTDYDCTIPVTAGTTYVPANTYYTISGQTGIKSITLGNTTVSTKVTSGVNAGRFELSVPTASQSGSLNITVKDTVENSARLSPFTYKLDNTEPRVSLTTPSVAAAASGVNGSVTIAGVVNDGLTTAAGIDGQLKKITVEYSLADQVAANTTAPTGADDWYQINEDDTISCSLGQESFNIVHDFSSLTQILGVNSSTGKIELQNDSTTASKYVWIKITAEDTAGWTTVKTQKVLIDRDADRPVIKLTSMTLGTGMGSDSEARIPYENSELSGTISDDDGIPLGLEYKIGEGGSWSTSGLTYSTSDGLFTLSLNDGVQDVYFRIKDATSTATNEVYFESRATSTGTYTLNAPKLTDKSNNEYGYKTSIGTRLNTVIYAKVDTQAPFVDTPEFTRTPAEATPVWSSSISGAVFGGTKNILYLRQYAYDVNGVKGVYLSIPKDAGDGISTAVTAWSYTDSVTKVKTTYYTSGSNPDASSSYWNTYKFVPGTTAATGTISSVTKNTTTNVTDTVTIGGVVYTKEAYVFELYETSETTTIGGNTYKLWASYASATQNKEINVANLVTSNRSAALIATDGIKSTSTPVTLVIDNTAPIITFNGPSTTGSVTGKVTGYGSIDSTGTVYYAISPSGTIKPDAGAVSVYYDDSGSSHAITGNGGSCSPTYTNHQITDASISWFVYFDAESEELDSDHSADSKTHGFLLNNYLVDYGITTSEAISTTSAVPFDTLVKLYLWIKAVDECGNVKEECREFKLDPQGDRPTVEYSYPTTDGDVFGGEIRLTGSATDDEGNNPGVKNVWAQIISSTHTLHQTFGEPVSPEAEPPLLTDPYGWATKTFGTFEINASKQVTSLSVTKNDLDYMVAAGYELFEMSAFDKDNPNDSKYTGTIPAGKSPSDYGIKCTLNGSSWSLSINRREELNVPVGTNGVVVRVKALDKDNKFSTNVDKYMVFDAQNPVIGNSQPLYLIQSASNSIDGTGDSPSFGATASKEYRENMFVRGEWFLIGSVEDNDSIKELKIGTDILMTTGTIQTNATKWDVKKSSDGKKVYFKYKLNTSTGVDKLTFDVYTEDGATPTAGKTRKTLNVAYDNIAPVLANVTDSSYNISPEVKQSNGFYSFGSKVSEDSTAERKNQSGLDFVAFYFMRRNTVGGPGAEVDTIYDPMIKPTVTTPNATTVSASTPVMSANGTEANNTIVYKNGLYWIAKTVTASGSSLDFTTDRYIKTNGLVMADGSLYKITGVTSSSVTLDSNVPSTVTKAYFALAMLVDNKTRESGGNEKNTQGYPSTVYNDDGDGMVEYVKESDGTWSADIVSKNIPDGPIELHYVAFDAAGNYSIGIMGNHSENAFATSTGLNQTPDRNEYISLKTNPNRTSNVLYVDGGDENAYMNGGAAVPITNTNLKGAAFIANNAPRLAALKIWTNYNDDAVEDDDEIKWYYCSGEQVLIGGIGQTRAKQITDNLIVSGNSADYSNSGTPYMTIKGQTTFTPEIVGGNGSLYYKSRIGTASTVGSKTWSALSDAFVTGNGSSDNYMDATGTYVDTGTDKLRRGTIEITPAIIEANCKNAAGTGTNGTYWFDYKIWDSTEGTVTGTNSLSAKMCVALDVQYFDTTPPNVVMKPLYWKSNTDNSVYKRANNDNKLEGHIELAQDLAGTALGTGYGSYDDKISGKVVFSGYAYDNKSLKKLDWNILSSDGTATLMSGTGATLSGATWTSTATMAANHYEFKVYSAVDTTKGITADDVYRNGNGHKVAWELAVDTSYISGIVAENAKVQIIAYDASGTGGAAGLSNSATANEPPTSLTDLIQIDKQKNVPSYQVDIMPYITDVITRLAGKDKVTPVIYSRTAKGHYPIASSETLITLKGYNLAAGGASVTIDPSTVITSSGQYNYSVNGITAVNNINNNSAHGDYDITNTELSAETKAKNMYNMTPNTSTNLTLTDDIYFDVWEVNNNAATSGAALKYPVMHINPTNGQIGFGFVKGGDSVSFPANGYSYTWYQKNRKDYIGTNFVYDTKGVAHTISIGLDAQWDTGIAGRMNYNNSTWWAATTTTTNAWGQTEISGGNNGKDLIKQWDKTYNIALESIGIPNGIYVKGQAVDTTSTDGKGIIDTERFSTPSIAASTHGDNTAIYIMYYDSDHDQIRFRYGEVPNNATSRNDGNYGLLNDSRSEGYNGVDNTGINSDTTVQNSSWGDHDMFEAHRGYYALVTGDYYKQKNDGLTGTEGSLLNSTGNYGSEYNALDVVRGSSMNNDVVVIVWYDQINSRLMYIYRYNLGTNDTASNVDASTSAVSGAWSAPKTIYNGAVQDCVIKVDDLNGIHIAAYDQNNADLKYFYMAAYNSDTVYSCTVDSYSQVGSKISIDTALNAAGTKAIPYISYYAEGLSALPKVAFLPGGVSSSTASTDVKEGVNSSNQFTGDWEVSMVPTSSTLQKYNVNVGLFKTAGKLDSTKTGTNDVSNLNERNLYGNGSSHLVVGYAIRTSGVGYIETAMYKGVPEY